MIYTVSITSQGQISIPAPIRRMLGLNLFNTANVYVKDNKIILKPVTDFMSLKGSLKTNKPPLSNKKMHEMFAREWADNVT